MLRRVIALLAVGLAVLSAPAHAADEPYRPSVHYTPADKWMNDPNGLIFYGGKYHLFYQYNPEENAPGNGSWGHAVSTDLVHWERLPLAISHDAEEDVWSGSVVYDRTNASGYGTAAKPPLVAVYTSFHKADGIQRQALASSTDGGLTWTKRGPVLDIGSRDFRDPKVFWYAPTSSWRMVVALSAERKVSVYSSPDLRSWTHLSDFGPLGATQGVWECPDLFPLAVDGDPARTKWVMVVSSLAGRLGQQYYVGDFDGTTFTSTDPATPQPPAGTVLGDFEGSYGDWTRTGTAFGDAPATGTLPDQSPVTGQTGSGLVNTFLGGDGPTGDLTSPEFLIDRPYLAFQIGGGRHPYVEGASNEDPPGTVFADFEGDSWGEGWTATGDFAGAGPSTGDLPGRHGAKALDTCVGPCDPATGTITSPPFTVSAAYLDFLVAGGNHPGQTAVNLLVDGQIVASATGDDSPNLRWISWNLAAHQGKQAQVQIVDTATGGWGHLMADQFVLSSGPAAPRLDQTSVDLLVDGQVVRTATGQDSEHLDWTSWDLRDLAGKRARIRVADRSTGGWGHVLADRFTLADAPVRSGLEAARWIDHGPDFYAAVTFNDAPRRVLVGWMNNWNYGADIPTTPYNGIQSIPRELALKTVDGRISLIQEPVRELRTARQASATGGKVLDLDLKWAARDADRFGVDLRVGPGQATRVGYDVAAGELYVDRTRSGLVAFNQRFPGVDRVKVPLRDGRLRLRIVLDASTVEVFADDGAAVVSQQIFPGDGDAVVPFSEGGTASLVRKDIWRLG
ncbi:hypothetical protein GCM10027589_47500 [Actinocorallia lasiicapitis]